MSKQALIVIALAILVIAYALYRSRGTGLNVEPHAAEEIEKAKGR